jgi:hypothetical protein
MTTLDHALWYAANGWRVVPIPTGYKYPKGIAEWETKATTDPERIRRYYAANPTHGVGIATGPASGLFVIDIDPRDGGDDSLVALEARYGRLPDTVEAITGGNGRHIYLRWPETGEIHNSASGVLGVGIDVRGINGQVLAAPTIHPTTGQAYQWDIEHDPMSGQAVADAPQWLIDLLQAPVGNNEARRERIARIDGEMKPGDIWAQNTTWADELTKYGATLHSQHTDSGGGYYELWTRPGKSPKDGASASLYYGGTECLKVFSSNWAPFTATEMVTLWGFHVAMEHGGDFYQAAKEHGEKQRIDLGDPFTDPRAEVEGRRPRRGIVHNGRQHDEVVAEAMLALQEANDPPAVFVRAGQLCRLRQDEDDRPLIEALRPEHVRLQLAHAANWYRVNKDGDHSSTSPPGDVAASIVASGAWDMPALAGVVELPVLRPDGTFQIGHGYDGSTRLFHWHRGKPYPGVSDEPTAAELAAAVALIDETLCDFPWDSTADRANAWALFLTPLVRAIVGQVPMALVDAPEPGTGKGLLVKVAAIITIGRAAALMAWPTGDEELEKKVTAALMAGSTMLIFDNVEGVIKSPTLAAVLTADSWQGRVLGRSEMVTVPNRATWACTGNNIDVGGDLARRCYRIRLDARQASPWLRTGFKHADLGGWVSDNRGELLHALCTIIRSWWVAGRPMATNAPAMGDYSRWVRTVGGILDHAGVKDFLGNLADFHASADREAGAWEAFLGAWFDQVGEESLSVGDLVAKMRDPYTGDRILESLPDELAGEWGKGSFTQRLGQALRKRTGRHYGASGMHLVEMPRDRRRVVIYSVTKRSVAMQSAGLAEAPREGDAVSRDDAKDAGLAGLEPPTPREKSYPQGGVSAAPEIVGQRGETAPQAPQPRADDLGRETVGQRGETAPQPRAAASPVPSMDHF